MASRDKHKPADFGPGLLRIKPAGPPSRIDGSLSATSAAVGTAGTSSISASTSGAPRPISRIAASHEGTPQDWDALRHFIAHRPEFDDPAGMLDTLEAYSDLIHKWAPTYNLIGPAARAHFPREHLLDCLLPVPEIARMLDDGPAQRRLLVDIGSGAGLPGIVLAIAMPRLHLALVEPSQKRCAFLRQAVASLNIPNASVHECRIEELSRDNSWHHLRESLLGHGGPDFISRAFTGLSELLGHCLPYAAPGSWIHAMKSAQTPSEIRNFESSAYVDDVESPQVMDLTMPDVHGTRTLISVRVKSGSSNRPDPMRRSPA